MIWARPPTVLLLLAILAYWLKSMRIETGLESRRDCNIVYNLVVSVLCTLSLVLVRVK